jgi:multidrug resistance efflux pump
VNDDPGLEQRLERLEAEVAELESKFTAQQAELDQAIALLAETRVAVDLMALRLMLARTLETP